MEKNKKIEDELDEDILEETDEETGETEEDEEIEETEEDEEIEETEEDEADKETEEKPEKVEEKKVRRGRGRPKGSKNKPKFQVSATTPEVTTIR